MIAFDKSNVGESDMMMLAGGLPSPEYFPFDSISAKTLAADSYSTSVASSGRATYGPSSSSAQSSLSWLWNLLGMASPKLEDITVPKYPRAGSPPDAVQLATALQYGKFEVSLFINTYSSTYIYSLVQASRALYQPLQTSSKISP